MTIGRTYSMFTFIVGNVFGFNDPAMRDKCLMHGSRSNLSVPVKRNDHSVIQKIEVKSFNISWFRPPLCFTHKLTSK